MRVITWPVSIILALVVAGLAFIYFTPGYDMYIVRSESMKPTIEMGDLIITSPVGGFPSHKIEPGTIISYKKGKETVTHRILSMNNDAIVTKGDAVEHKDAGALTTSQITGIYLFRIPKLGYLANFLHAKLGWFLTIIVPTIVLEFFIIKEIIKEALSIVKGRKGKSNHMGGNVSP
jgi:signal peptidase I